jgi:hypothetical protein
MMNNGWNNVTGARYADRWPLSEDGGWLVAGWLGVAPADCINEN